LPYPGGPEISKLAELGREQNITPSWILPRPMIKTPDYDFSFSGIKTAVLYTVRNILKNTLKKNPHANPLTTPTDAEKTEIALEFENAVTEVLLAKTQKAIDQFGIKTLIIGGGVIANTYIRKSFQTVIKAEGNLSFDKVIK